MPGSGIHHRSFRRRRFNRRSFHRSFLCVKMLAKLLRSWASDRGAYSRLALCGCLVTIATHLLCQTVGLCFGAPTSVPDASLIPPRPYSGFRCGEHCALGQNAHMGMMVVLPPPLSTQGLVSVATGLAALINGPLRGLFEICPLFVWCSVLQ